MFSTWLRESTRSALPDPFGKIWQPEKLGCRSHSLFLCAQRKKLFELFIIQISNPSFTLELRKETTTTQLYHLILVLLRLLHLLFLFLKRSTLSKAPAFLGFTPPSTVKLESFCFCCMIWPNFSSKVPWRAELRKLSSVQASSDTEAASGTEWVFLKHLEANPTKKTACTGAHPLPKDNPPPCSPSDEPSPSSFAQCDELDPSPPTLWLDRCSESERSQAVSAWSSSRPEASEETENKSYCRMIPWQPYSSIIGDLRSIGLKRSFAVSRLALLRRVVLAIEMDHMRCCGQSQANAPSLQRQHWKEDMDVGVDTTTVLWWTSVSLQNRQNRRLSGCQEGTNPLVMTLSSVEVIGPPKLEVYELSRLYQV